ncbi:dTDP-4-dehydrorhamnose reductase [Paracoccus sediminis]|uniref:dTDP-4-dehydrorhamnose reductase n=1 Tax=Paracoccus sediminis TaxID=1214787 RepID=A0A238W4T4_9RHOB|nr:dTDP-4-dehydrorhamnose reductase [Paracoccus sediminis]TBN51559.1 dTDP-4-dehydrorhamnose reductase [Paracoccus sediminis]SNR41334.1 dTDP-4-dehydrorhamnose reductase [Paracoccus sediminis]
MKGLLVLGKSGQLAQGLARLAPDAAFWGRAEADLSRPEAVMERIRALRPLAIINASAYTAVDKAETDVAAAAMLNATAPGLLARAAADLGVPFLHVSTDYVFDGGGDHSRTEDAATAPLGIYGQTKRDGERQVAAAGGQWVVMRTSWVFSPDGGNFVKTMLRLGADRDRIDVVADQIGGPTEAGRIAAALLDMAGQMLADPRKGGLYHFAGAPDVSWADFARAIFCRARLDCAVQDIPASDYPTPARRPANSRLDCSKIAHDFGIARPDWRADLDHVLNQLGYPS